MRCPDCNKFVSYDEPQCEVNDVDVSGDTVTARVTVQLNCQDCGNTLKDSEIEAQDFISHECVSKDKRDKNWEPDEDFKKGDDQYEVAEEGCAEGTSRMQDKDRKGKPILLSRYKKTYYGFTLEPEIKCRKCGEVFGVTLEGEEQASAFNECC